MTGAKTGNIGCSFLHCIFSDQRLDSEGNRQKCRRLAEEEEVRFWHTFALLMIKMNILSMNIL